MNRQQRNEGSTGQRGSLSVELALLLAFVLMPVLAGVVDFGQILLAQATATRAAREGAMAAVRNQNINQAVNQYMQNAGYDLTLTTVTTTGNRTAGSPVTVTVTYNTSRMVIIPWSGISSNFGQVVGTATARQT